MRRGVALLIASFLAGCFVPVKRSAECQEMIDSCLKTCQRAAPPGIYPAAGARGGWNETQTSCERGCNDVCNK